MLAKEFNLCQVRFKLIRGAGQFQGLVCKELGLELVTQAKLAASLLADAPDDPRKLIFPHFHGFLEKISGLLILSRGIEIFYAS